MFSIKKIVGLLILLSFALPSVAEEAHFRLKFGGWSKHFNSDKRVYVDYNFNEVHNGIGLQYWHNIKDYKWDIGGEYFTMKDSHYKRSHMISFAVRYPFSVDLGALNEISIQTGLTYHDRTRLHTVHNVDYIDGEKKLGYIEHHVLDSQIFTPMLVTTFTFWDTADIDFILLPRTKYAKTAVSFVRLGIKF